MHVFPPTPAILFLIQTQQFLYFRMAEKAEASIKEEPKLGSAAAKEPMDEVFRVNHLLQIKDLDWKRQLQQAVSAPFYTFF